MKSIFLTLVLSLGLAAAPSPASAQAGRGNKPPAGDAKKDKKKKEAPAGPADAAAFAGDIDDSPEWFKKTDDAILLLTDLIRSLDEGDVKATRMIQLAELQWQKSSRLHLKAVKEHNKKYDDWFLNDGASRGQPEPKLSSQPAERESDAVMQKAVKIYEHVITKYPKNPRGDQAHYYLGQSYLQLGEKDKAIQTFKKLVARYPQSDFIPDAYLGLGEFFFENKKLDEAHENYTKATQFPNSKNWGFAKYKLGWTEMNRGQCPVAIKHFKDVVAFSMKPGQNLEYKEQALKDLVNTYTECGEVDEAERYFTSVGGENYFVKFLEIYGARLFEQGRDDESIKIYRRLIAREPMGQNNLTYEGEVLKAFIRKADRPSVLTQLGKIVSMTKEDSPWVKANQAQQEDIKRQRDSLEGTVSKYAREVFEEAKKLSAEQKIRGLGQAEQFCDYYLDTFPTKANAYPIRMMLGETQYMLGQLSKEPKVREQKFAAALETYIKEVEADPKGEFLALAAENAIFAAEEIVKLRKPSPRPDAKDKAHREIPQTEQNVIRACDVYVKHVPKGPKVIPTRYKAAYLFYEFNHEEEALKRFREVIETAPSSQQARFAADLTMDVYGEGGKNDPVTVNKLAKEFLKIEGLVRQKDDEGKEYRKTLQVIAERSDYNICAMQVKEKKSEEAANCFTNFAKVYTASDLADEAYYSASVQWVESGKVDRAIEMREQFIKLYPDHERTPEVINYLATNYRKVTNFDAAADKYELLSAKHPKFAAACDGLYNAAFFRENLGETQKAIGNYRQYMKQCADRADVHEVLYTIALIHEKKKDEANMVKTLEEYMKTYGSKKSADLYLDAKLKIADTIYEKNKKSAYPKYQDIIDTYKNLSRQKVKIGPTGLGAAARSAFVVLEPKYDDYNAIKLNEKKTLAKNIGARLKLIKPLRDSYEKVVTEYRHGETAVAVLYQIGKMSDDFVSAIKASPMPEELKTEAQKELYLYELGEQFRPVEEAAIEYYAKCVKTSADYKIYNSFTLKSIDSLERLRASVYVPDTEYRLAAGPNVQMFESSPIVEVK